MVGAMDAVEFLARQGGAARLAHLCGAGITRHQVGLALGAGRILRSRQGVYQLPGVRQDYLAAMTANAALTCLSAAGHYRLWNINPAEKLHLASAHRRMEPDHVPHRTNGKITALQPPVLELKDVLVHALQCLPELEALVMVECACNRGESSPAFLRGLLPGPRNGRARDVLDLVERGSDSLLETVARVLFRRHGLTVETQVYLDGIGYVDFLINGCLIVEIDGAEFHMDKKQFKKDLRRNNTAISRGYRNLRYAYEDVLHRPEQMLAQIRQTLATPPRPTR